MSLPIAAIILLLAELAYFRLAERLNIIDRPNERSSHTRITIRGGGIIFYLGALYFFIASGFKYPLFFLGLTTIAAISFLDDIFTVRSSIRLLAHCSSMFFLFMEIGFSELPIYLWPIVFVISIGVINAYNFMDGINGMHGMYSIIVFLSLLLLPEMQGDYFLLIHLQLLALTVFGIFNFRSKAKCFAGDVGSVTTAYIVIFILLNTIIVSGKVYYIGLLAVYGVDAILTIMHRLMRKENIFEAHRSHLYQWMVHIQKMKHLQVSLIYALIQALISFWIIENEYFSYANPWILSIGSIAILCGIYIFYKYQLNKKQLLQ